MKRATHVSGLDRLVFFSDGIYAIAATLLAIDIRVPTTQEPLRIEQLANLAPSIAVFALTFLVIALFWVSHHRMFAMIVRVDYALVWLNMLVLLVVAFLPAANRVFAHNMRSPYAVVFYAGAASVTALANIILWWYATHRRRHIDDHASPRAVCAVYRRHLSTLAVLLVAMALSFANTMVAFSVILL